MLRRFAGAAPGLQLLAVQALKDGAGARRDFASGLSTELAEFAVTNKGVKAGPGGRSSISGITATVFGCTGFLGRYVVNALARQGSQVVVPYRCDDIDCQQLRQMGDLGKVVALKDFDVRSDEQVAAAVARSNVVINLIGAERETWNFDFQEVHVDIASRIAQAAAANPLTERFIHLSALGAAHDAPSKRLRTKAAGEEAVRAALPDATIFKPGPLVGTEDRLYNVYARLAKALPFIPLAGGGEARLQPVFVRDVADAVTAALKSRESAGKDYFLAGPEPLTVRQIVELVFDTIREPCHIVPVPRALMKLFAMPRERLLKTIPVPVPTIYTADYLDETAVDNVLPPGVMTFADLGITPRSVTEGMCIEHVRHFRVGGYDFGTTSGTTTSGGAGFGG